MSQQPNPASRPDRNTRGKNAVQPRHWVFLLGIVVLLVINLASATLLLPSGPQRVDVPYTLFKQQVEAGNVADIASRGDTIQGTFRQPVTPDAQLARDHAPRQSSAWKKLNDNSGNPLVRSSSAHISASGWLS